MSLLLKNNAAISKLALYDIAHTPGVAADLSHINTKASVEGFLGPDSLGDCLEGSQMVLIPAGVPRKPGKRSLWEGVTLTVHRKCLKNGQIYVTVASHYMRNRGFFVCLK